MAGLGAGPLGIQATAIPPVTTSLDSAGRSEGDTLVSDLSVAYVQESSVRGFVDAETSATEVVEEELLLARRDNSLFEIP